MSRLPIGLTLLLFAVAAPAAKAAIRTIDFETLADWEVVDDQFLSQGADFNGLAVAARAGQSLNPTYPPHSGQTVIVDHPFGTGTVRVDAVGPLWDYVAGYVTGAQAVTMTAYDSGGNPLGTAATPGPNWVGSPSGYPPNILLSISAPQIAYVEFEDSGNTYTIDDFSFRQIPEPTTLVIWGVLAAAAITTGSLRSHRRRGK